MRVKQILFASLFLLFLTACEGPKKDPLDDGGTVSELYNRAFNTLTQDKNYKKSAQQFEEVQRQHPFSPWASKAELMAAYAYFEADAYEDALANLKNYVKLHPHTPFTPYAYYMIGMNYYVQLKGVNREQEMTFMALNAFRDLIRRYPQSVYAKDAALKIDLCREHLAGQDMEVGRFYQNSALPIAALDRFTNVIQMYQTTSHVPEALHRLVEVMLTLGMKKQALVNAAVLGYNFPGSKWYSHTYDLLKKNQLISLEVSAEGFKKTAADAFSKRQKISAVTTTS